MTQAWSILMLITAGLFLSGVVPISWERAPAWRRQDDATFRADFTHTLRRVDRLQPALLVGCVVASSGFAVTTTGASRVLAALAAACMLAILIGSGVRLVPIQSRLADPAADLSAHDTDEGDPPRDLTRSAEVRYPRTTRSTSTLCRPVARHGLVEDRRNARRCDDAFPLGDPSANTSRQWLECGGVRRA